MSSIYLQNQTALLCVSLLVSMMSTLCATSSDDVSGSARSAAPTANSATTPSKSRLRTMIVAALLPSTAEQHYRRGLCSALSRLLGPQTWLSAKGPEASSVLSCLHDAQGAPAVRLAPSSSDRAHILLVDEDNAQQMLRRMGNFHYLLVVLTHRVREYVVKNILSTVNETVPVAVAANVSDTPGIFCTTQDGFLKDMSDPFITPSRELPVLMEDLWLSCHGKPIIRVVLVEIKPIIYWHKSSDGERQLVGPEWQFLEVVLDRLAAGVEVHHLRNMILGAPGPDGKGFTGAVAEVWEGRADVLANMVYPWTWRGSFDATYPLKPSDYLLVVAKAGEWPRALCVLLPFSRCLWLACGAALLALSAAWSLLCYGGAGHSWPTTAAAAFFQVFSTFFTGSPCGRREREVSARMCAALVLVFGLVATNSYQGSLSSFFASPKQQTDADTLEEVDRISRSIFAFPPFSNVLRQAVDGDVMQRLADKLVARHDRWPQAYDLVAAGDGWAAVSGQSFADYYVQHPRYRAPSGRPLLHVARQPALSPAYCGYVARRGWPLTRRLSLAASRLHAAGVWGKLQAELHHRTRLNRGAGAADDVTGSGRAVLEAAHLGASFVVLAAGLAAGAVAFCVELRLGAAARPSLSVSVPFVP